LILKKELENSELPQKAKNILCELRNKINEKKILLNSLTIFQLRFNRVYPNFINNLSSHFSFLTQYEMVFISAHLMGLTTNQIADLLNISDGSVRKSRYRLKKKMGLKKDESFLNFIQSFNE
jgi:DNA-binding NarL/FixJ family response regulator